MEHLCAVGGKLESLTIPALACPAVPFARWCGLGKSVHTLHSIEIEDPTSNTLNGVTFAALAAAFPHLRALSIFIRHNISLEDFYCLLWPKLESFTVMGQWPSSRGDAGGDHIALERNGAESATDTAIERPLLHFRSDDFPGPLPPPIVARLWTVTSLHLPCDVVQHLMATVLLSSTDPSPLRQVRDLTLYRCHDEDGQQRTDGLRHWVLSVLRAAPRVTDLTFADPCVPLLPPLPPALLNSPCLSVVNRSLRRICYDCGSADLSDFWGLEGVEPLPPDHAQNLRTAYFPRLRMVVDGGAAASTSVILMATPL
jgi:hypothetical protein